MKKAGDWKEDIRRIVNLIIGLEHDKEKKVICIMGINKVEMQKQICMILGEAIAKRKKAVLVIHAEKVDSEDASHTGISDGEEQYFNLSDIIMNDQRLAESCAASYDDLISKLLGFKSGEKSGEVLQSFEYIIIDNYAIEQQAEAIAIAATCDETILLIEKGTVNGNRAMHLKREIDMNRVHVLGSIFIK